MSEATIAILFAKFNLTNSLEKILFNLKILTIDITAEEMAGKL